MAKKKSVIKALTEKIIKFRDARDWKQFHNPKDMSLSLILEASEVLEHFQWKNEEELKKYTKDNKKKIAEELADVLYWVLLLSHDLKINIAAALRKKLTKIIKDILLINLRVSTQNTQTYEPKNIFNSLKKRIKI